MRSKITISGLFSLIILIFVLGSCSLETKTIQPYLIQVDSIVAPDTVTPKTVFEIKLYGIVGPSGCYSLEKVYCFVTDDKNISIEARGNYRYEGKACPEGTVILDTKVETNVPSTGTYTIKVLRQDYSYLEQTLIAR